MSRTLRHPLRLLGALALANPLLAQAPAGRDTARLGVVVVTAPRVPTPLGASPAAVSVLAGDDLRARGIVRLADALREVPGAAVVQNGGLGGQTSLFLRGGESDYTKILVDGVPMNNPGGAFDFAHLNLDDVERIEIVRGPASVVYGSDAVAGVVNVITRRGADTRTRAAFRTGSWGSREADAAASGRARALEWAADAAHRRTDGVLAFNNEYRNTSAGASVGGRGVAGDVRLAARLTDGEYHYPTNGQGVPTDSNQYTTDRRLAVSLDAGRRLGRAEARLTAAATEIDAHARDERDGPTDPDRSRSTSESYRRGLDARVNVDAGRLGILTAGAAFERQQFATEGAGESEFGPYSLDFARHHRVTNGTYAQLAHVGTTLDYTVGARLDHNSVFGRFATARLGAGYRVVGGLRVRASVGNAYKEPNFDEQFETAFSRGNPDLEPERTLTWDAGIEQHVAGSRLVVAATWFDQRFANLVQYGYRQGPDSTDYLNGPEATARGLELELRAPRLAGGFGAAASFTALRTRAERDAGVLFVRGEPLIRRPSRQGSATVSWAREASGAAALTVNAVGRRTDVDYASFPAGRVELPGYATVDLSGEVPITWGAARRPLFTLTARAENLLDARYEAVRYFENPGRRVLFGARIGRD